MCRPKKTQTKSSLGDFVVMWEVYVEGKLKKEYPHKEQCLIWCYLKGYVNCAGGRDILQTCVKIKKGATP